MATVTLIDYTGKDTPHGGWHAAHMLLFTKSTRLNMDAGLMETIEALRHEEIIEELAYMAKTIPSSWEFADVTFLISDVSRACAQQITRTRTASFAMQSQRVTDVGASKVLNTIIDETPLMPVSSFTDEWGDEMRNFFDSCAKKSLSNYEELVHMGVKLQDARGILPMNICCNLVAKYNFRSLVELVSARSSLRVQGEYADIVTQMRSAVLRAYPWAQPFFIQKNETALKILEAVVEELGLETGKGTGWEVAKAMDLIRGVS